MTPATGAAQSTQLADGAWSTALVGLGWQTRQGPTEGAVLEKPDLVRQVVRAYLAAGATIIGTCTFAANPQMWARRRQTSDPLELSRVAAQLVREIVSPHAVRVAGVIGPSGALLALREVSEEALQECFVRQAEALRGGGADLIQFETFSDLAELLLAVRVVREKVGLPVLASLSFDSGPQRTRTAAGQEADRCAQELDECGADIVGCNCGAGAALMLPAVVAMRGHTKKPICARPSAGLPDLESGKPVYRVEAEEFAAAALLLAEAGADIVGGCCGAGPEHIRRLGAVLAGHDRAEQRKRAPRGGAR